MSANEIIRNFIIDNFLFGEYGGLKDDSSFLEEAIIDSTGIMELVAFLEKEFSVSIKDEELIPDNLDSVNKAAAFMERKKSVLPINSSSMVTTNIRQELNPPEINPRRQNLACP